MENLTKEEEKAIKSFQKLSKIWPKSLWIFSGAGTLCVMKYKHGRKRAVDKEGCMDYNYIVAKINIDNDGGDW